MKGTWTVMKELAQMKPGTELKHEEALQGQKVVLDVGKRNPMSLEEWVDTYRGELMNRA
jgi:hypothetical protein